MWENVQAHFICVTKASDCDLCLLTQQGNSLLFENKNHVHHRNFCDCGTANNSYHNIVWLRSQFQLYHDLCALYAIKN